MSKRYRITLAFTGTASLYIEADNADEAREKAFRLNVEDLARQGAADILQFKPFPREVAKVGSVLGEDDEPDQPKRRPSGWHRPALPE